MSINGLTINSASINGNPALDEEVYQLWLRQTDAEVVHLVEIDYVGSQGGAPKVFTLSLSDRPFPPYKNVILSIPSFSRQIGNDFTGAVTASYGEINLDNADGSLDSWLTLNFSGQKVRVFQGDPSWARERFRLINECIAEIVTSAAWDKINIRLRSVDAGSDQPIQTNLIPTTTTQSTANVVVPLAFGTVFNIDPAVVDATNQVYQWNDGAVTSVPDVRDGGVSFKTSQKTVTSVSGNTITTSAPHGFFANTRIRSDVGSYPTGTVNWAGMAWNGTLFCTVSSDNTTFNSVATSPDGINWTLGVMPSMQSWSNVIWNGTVFVALANGSVGAVSPDGLAWTVTSMPVSAFWGDAAWNGNFFLAIDVFTPSSLVAAISYDGFVWQAASVPAVTKTSLTWNGSVFCFLDYNNAFAFISSDAISWNAYATLLPRNWLDIAWNGTVFCAVGITNIVNVSYDGINWSTWGIPTGLWNSIAWNGTVFCAIDQANSIAATSANGTVWTTSALPASALWQTVVWNGTVFCVNTANTSYVTTSPDGVNWTPVVSTLPTPLQKFTDYWVSPIGLTTSAFQVTATRGGTPITLTSTTTNGVFVGYHWTSDNATGKLYLDSKPAGKLTMDGVAGSNDVATIVQKTLLNFNADFMSVLAFRAKCSQNVGVYVKERRNRIDVSKDVIGAVNGWYGAGRFGMLRFGRVDPVNSSAKLALTEEDMLFNCLAVDSLLMPKKTMRIGFAKNNTIQTSGLFAACSTDNVAYYGTTDRVALSTKAVTPVGAAAALSATLLAVIPDVQHTLLVKATDAVAESARLNDMYKGYGAVFSCEVGRIGTEIDIGDVVTVKHSRYGLSAGLNMTVVYIEDKPSSNTVVLKFYAYLGTYSPGQL